MKEKITITHDASALDVLLTHKKAFHGAHMHKKLRKGILHIDIEASNQKIIDAHKASIKQTQLIFKKIEGLL